MKAVLGSVLLVGLFGAVLSGIYQTDTGYLVQPAITTQHQLVSNGANVHYSPIALADGSGGYSSPVVSSSYGSQPASSGGYSSGSPPASSGGYSSGSPPANSGGYSSEGSVDSFADPRNRAPEQAAPKPVYGAPGMLALATSNDAPADSDSSAGSDFNNQELDAAIKSQDIVSVESSTAKSSTTTSAPEDEEFDDIDFTPPRRSFLSRAWTFITKQFSAVLGFLRRIWARVRGGSSS